MEQPRIKFSLDDVGISMERQVAEVDRVTAYSIIQTMLFQLAMTDSSQGTIQERVVEVKDDLTKNGERLPPRP